MTSPLQLVHVRVNDAATGQPTPVRIRFAGPDGTYYPPHGRLARFAVTDIGVDVGGNVMVGDQPPAQVRQRPTAPPTARAALGAPTRRAISP